MTNVMHSYERTGIIHRISESYCWYRMPETCWNRINGCHLSCCQILLCWMSDSALNLALMMRFEVSLSRNGSSLISYRGEKCTTTYTTFHASRCLHRDEFQFSAMIKDAIRIQSRFTFLCLKCAAYFSDRLLISTILRLS